MIDLEEIKSEIDRLKKEDTTYRNCEKLAVLSSVLSYMHSEGSQNGISTQSDINSQLGKSVNIIDSEFISAAEKAGTERLLKVLDEHMNSIKLVYPKEYSLIIKRLTE